jgi:hypothetical protein
MFQLQVVYYIDVMLKRYSKILEGNGFDQIYYCPKLTPPGNRQHLMAMLMNDDQGDALGGSFPGLNDSFARENGK